MLPAIQIGAPMFRLYLVDKQMVAFRVRVVLVAFAVFLWLVLFAILAVFYKILQLILLPLNFQGLSCHHPRKE